MKTNRSSAPPPALPQRVLFFGLGSPHGDDAVGWQVADELQSCAPAGVDVRRAATPLAILDDLEGVARLAICDACRGGGRPGTWHRWNWPHPDLPFFRPAGTHDLGLATCLEIATRLGMLPAEVLLWGIEIDECRPGEGLSPEVRAAIPAVAGSIAAALRDPDDGPRTFFQTTDTSDTRTAGGRLKE